jgi:pimeloyl-ACP methyl ester carboxylesterase
MPIARVNGIDLNYAVAGQGIPLVMIMGMGFGQKGWIFQTRFFKKYFQVITFDNRGAGNSDKPEGPYTIRMMADDTIGLMDHLHIDKAHILGISLGGMIAQELAVNYPQRVNRLVLGCTFCKQDNNTSGDYPEWGKAVESGLKGNYDPMFDKLFNKRLNQIILGSVLKRALKKSGEAGTRGIAGQYQASAKHNTADKLPRINLPTLVIGGTADRVMKPSSFKVLSSLIPQSKLIMIENGSHSIFVETRGRFNREVLNFLKSS